MKTLIFVSLFIVCVSDNVSPYQGTTDVTTSNASDESTLVPCEIKPILEYDDYKSISTEETNKITPYQETTDVTLSSAIDETTTMPCEKSPISKNDDLKSTSTVRANKITSYQETTTDMTTLSTIDETAIVHPEVAPTLKNDDCKPTSSERPIIITPYQGTTDLIRPSAIDDTMMMSSEIKPILKRDDVKSTSTAGTNERSPNQGTIDMKTSSAIDATMMMPSETKPILKNNGLNKSISSEGANKITPFQENTDMTTSSAIYAKTEPDEIKPSSKSDDVKSTSTERTYKIMPYQETRTDMTTAIDETTIVHDDNSYYDKYASTGDRNRSTNYTDLFKEQNFGKKNLYNVPETKANNIDYNSTRNDSHDYSEKLPVVNKHHTILTERIKSNCAYNHNCSIKRPRVLHIEDVVPSKFDNNHNNKYALAENSNSYISMQIITANGEINYNYLLQVEGNRNDSNYVAKTDRNQIIVKTKSMNGKECNKIYVLEPEEKSFNGIVSKNYNGNHNIDLHQYNDDEVTWLKEFMHNS